MMGLPARRSFDQYRNDSTFVRGACGYRSRYLASWGASLQLLDAPHPRDQAIAIGANRHDGKHRDLSVDARDDAGDGLVAIELMPVVDGSSSPPSRSVTPGG
jgi:hypothetical protein